MCVENRVWREEVCSVRRFALGRIALIRLGFVCVSVASVSTLLSLQNGTEVAFSWFNFEFI